MTGYKHLNVEPGWASSEQAGWASILYGYKMEDKC